MSQLNDPAAPVAPATQPPAAPAQQQEPDIFADGFSESDISAMFDADNGGNDGGTHPPAEAPEGTQPPDQQEGEAPQEQHFTPHFLTLSGFYAFGSCQPLL